MRSALLSAIALLCLSTLPAVSQESEAADDVVGWATRIVETARDRGASYDSLTVAIPQKASNQTAAVEIVTPGKLHMFGSVLAFAAGASDSSRTKERKWSIRFPVRIAAPTLTADTAKLPASVATALADLEEHLAAYKTCSVQQFQLQRATSEKELPGLERVPMSVTLLGPAEETPLGALRALTRKHRYAAVDSIHLSPVGSRTLMTASGMFLIAAGERTPGAASAERAEASVQAVLGAAQSGPLQVLKQEKAVRVQFEAVPESPSAGWKMMSGLTGIAGLSAFQILEMRQGTGGETKLSGLLYF